MAVDSATSVGAFDETIPTNSDDLGEGDNNFRHVKGVLKTCFPAILGVVTASHTELSYVDGVTSALQTQIDLKAPAASPTLTGTPVAPTATAGTSSTQLATTAFVATAVAGASVASFNATTTAIDKNLTDFEWVMVTASSKTMTLPASPTVGSSVVRISTRSGITTTIARNGKAIMGLSEDMTVELGSYTVTLAYHNATDGWCLQ